MFTGKFAFNSLKLIVDNNKHKSIKEILKFIMQNITVRLTAFSLVREKGTLELLIVTLIKSSELIIGKMIPYILIGSIDFIISLFFGTLWFDVPIKGYWI
ncbi:hypothetical protein [Tepidibacter sp. Z1-5]|uniref:hypothetical protein n=1 Tax=Tepidibacter sp. Z1-5 TaxID=3134138 RepID=UPI0030C2CB4B